MNNEELKKYKTQKSNLTKEEEKLRNIYLRDLNCGKIQGPHLNYPSVDRAWYKYYDEESINIETNGVSVVDMFFDTCEKHKDDIHSSYILSDDITIDIPFKEEKEKIIKYAKALSFINNDNDEIILTILPNFPENKELLFSALKTGIKFFPFNPLLPASFLDKVLKENNIKTIFIYSGFLEKDGYREVLTNNLDKIDRIIYLDGIESINSFIFKTIAKLKQPHIKKLDTEKSMSFSEFEKLSQNFKGDLDDYYWYDENKTAVLFSTSGTTGVPKIVKVNGKEITTFILEHGKDFMDLSADDRYLDVMILGIAYGLMSFLVTSVKGIRTYYAPGFVSDVIDAIKKYDITQFVGGPIHVNSLCKYLENHEYDLPIRAWVTGGAPLSKDVEEKVNSSYENFVEDDINTNKVKVRQGLGSTESLGAALYQKDGTYKFGGVGIPMSKMLVSIFKPNSTEECEYNEPGEICFSGETIMQGYLNNGVETKKVLIKHEDDNKVWFHTGDIGYMDKDGHVFFVDRIKNMFERNGMNVHPTTVANFIKTFEYVNDAVVTGVSHPDEQMVPVAFVKLNKKVDEFDREVLEYITSDIKSKAFRNLEESSVPYEIIFVDDIPLNAGGKADVDLLVKKYDIDYFKSNKGNVHKLSLMNMKI